MFCHGCLIRFLSALRLAIRLAQASVTAWLIGDIPSAYAHAHNFAQVWEMLLQAVGRTNR